MEEKGKNMVAIGEISDVETFRQRLYDFVKS
jgi:hypothetical protein